MNKRLEGGCQVPIGCYADYIDGTENLLLRGLVGSPDGLQILRAEAVAPAGEAERLGKTVAEELLSQGAAAILADVYGE